MAGYFELKLSASNKPMFVLKAGNHEVILTSQLYASRASAEEGIASVRRNAPDDARYERKSSATGQPFFVLTAANGQSIGQSELYSGTAAMENGIASVKKNAPEAAVKDLIPAG